MSSRYQFLDGFLIPDRIAQAFEGRTSLTLAEAANALEMDERHLREAADKGRIHYLMLTHVRSRKMRRFLLSDVIEFLKAERRQDCPTAIGRARRPAAASSGSTVSAFQALRERLNNPQPGPGRSKRG